MKRRGANGYEKVDAEELRRSVKSLSEDELRQRVAQLEQQVLLYKRMIAAQEHCSPSNGTAARYSSAGPGRQMPSIRPNSTSQFPPRNGIMVCQVAKFFANNSCYLISCVFKCTRRNRSLPFPP